MSISKKYIDKFEKKLSAFLISKIPIWQRFLGSLFLIGCASLTIWFFEKIENVHLYSIFMAVTVLAAISFGLISSMFIGISGALITDFFFTPPIYNMFESTASYLRFFIYIFMAFIVSAVTHIVKREVFKSSKLNEELVLLNEQKDHLMAMIAHDLRNPIGNIITLVEMIKSGETPLDQLKDDLDIMERSARVSLEIVSEVLNFSTINHKDFKAEERIVNLNFLLRNISDSNQLAAKKKSITLTLKHPAQMISVYGDEVLLYRTFQNLVDNAIKYSNRDSNVNIEVKATGSDVEVSIKDNGLGIDEDEQKKLFQPFYKTSNRPTGGESSTGLGLSSVAQIIKLHKGKITVQSNKTQGSTFTVFLPAESVQVAG